MSPFDIESEVVLAKVSVEYVEISPCVTYNPIVSSHRNPASLF